MNEHVQAAFSMKFYKFFILQKKRNCKFFQQKDKCDNGYLNANGTTAADDDNCDDNGGDDDHINTSANKTSIDWIVPDLRYVDV